MRGSTVLLPAQELTRLLDVDVVMIKPVTCSFVHPLFPILMFVIYHHHHIPSVAEPGGVRAAEGTPEAVGWRRRSVLNKARAAAGTADIDEGTVLSSAEARPVAEAAAEVTLKPPPRTLKPKFQSPGAF